MEYCDKYQLKPWEYFKSKFTKFDKLLWWYRWKAYRDEAIKVKEAENA